MPPTQSASSNRAACGSPVLLKVSFSRGGPSQGSAASGCSQQQAQYRLQLNTMHLSSANLAQQLAVAKQFVVDTVTLSLPAPRPPSAPFPSADLLAEAQVAHASPAAPSSESQRVSAVEGGKGSSLPPLSFGDIAIVEVTFNHNLLTDDCFAILIPFLASNTHIRSFEILGNRLTDGVAPYLRQLILECPHIKRMKLADNFLSEAAAVEIGEAILSASYPSPTSALPLLPSPRTSRRFLQLNVGGNVVGPKGIKTLCEAALASGLQILGLRGVRLDPVGWAACGALCAAYAHPAAAEPSARSGASFNMRLKHRRSSGPSVAVGGGGESFAAGAGVDDGEDEIIFSDDGDDGDDDEGTDGCTSSSGPSSSEPHLTSHCVRELQVKMNPMNQACMESFVQSALHAATEQVKAVTMATAAASSESNAPLHSLSSGPSSFATFSTITALNLACCAIDATLCRRLVDLLYVTKYLEELDLSGNHLSDLGTRSLCEWLNSTAADCLKFFSLGNNHLTAASLHMLSDAFRHHAHRELRLLDLGSNVFGVAATPHLIQLLMHTPSLEKLHLRGCLVGGPYLGALVRQITSLTRLSDLDFTANLSGEEGYQWQWLITSSTSIRRLLLTDNSMTASATTAIANAIGKSTTSRLVVLQIGGKSKVEPFGNTVTAAAHGIVLRGIHRNRQGGPHPPLSLPILSGSGGGGGNIGLQGLSSPPPPPPPPLPPQQQHQQHQPSPILLPIRGSSSSPVNHAHAMGNFVSFAPAEVWTPSLLSLGADRTEFAPVSTSTSSSSTANSAGLLGATVQSSSINSDKESRATLLDATIYKSSSSMGTTRRGSSATSRFASFSRSLNSTVVASPVDDTSTITTTTTMPSRAPRLPDLGDVSDVWMTAGGPSSSHEGREASTTAVVPGDQLGHSIVSFSSVPQFLPPHQHHQPQLLSTPVFLHSSLPGQAPYNYPHYLSMARDASASGSSSSAPSAAATFPTMMYHPGTSQQPMTMQQPMVVSSPPPTGAFYVYRLPESFE